MTESDRFRGCLLGLAMGDALGTTVEFRRRGTFEAITDMVGGGPFDLEPGEWTDDTSMALCLAESLVETGGFDPRDQMERYCRWRDSGYLSSNGRCFDIGGTVASALRRYHVTGDPFAGSADPESAGNGCIMRLAPVPMFFFPDEAVAQRYAGESSRTTHGAAECIDACRLFAGMICRALGGQSKERVLLGDADTAFDSPRISAIARGDYRELSERDIRGTGYVVASLQAAAWCFDHGDSYEAAVLQAVNLGDDADTTAAVCGQLSGAYYGEQAIPARWRAKLVKRDTIATLAERLRQPAR
jgi:ADP-ribosyl-[dinitrogen reductase] hydrolase